jgi:hypothetical protein
MHWDVDEVSTLRLHDLFQADAFGSVPIGQHQRKVIQPSPLPIVAVRKAASASFWLSKSKSK